MRPFSRSVTERAECGRSLTWTSSKPRCSAIWRTSRWVSAPATCPTLAQLVLGELLDLGQVVVARAHHGAQLGVGAPRLLGRRDRLARAAGEFLVQADEGAQGVVGHALAGPDRPGARVRRRPGWTARGRVRSRGRRARSGAVGSSRSDDRDAEALGDGAEQRQPRLALAVLHQRELAGGDADVGAELVEGEARARCGSAASAGPGSQDRSRNAAYGKIRRSFTVICRIDRRKFARRVEIGHEIQEEP